MTTSDSLGILGGGIFGIFVIIFALLYALITFLLPYIVWGILRQAKLTRKILEHIVAQNDHFEREFSRQAKEIAYQSELTVAALQRIKDSGDGLLTHAQYQTEVTKHRIALDSSSSPGVNG